MSDLGDEKSDTDTAPGAPEASTSGVQGPAEQSATINENEKDKTTAIVAVAKIADAGAVMPSTSTKTIAASKSKGTVGKSASLKSPSKTSRNQPKGKDDKTNGTRLGDESIYLPNTFPSTFEMNSREMASNIIYEVNARITRRRDVVHMGEEETVIIGESAVYSQRVIYRPIQPSCQFQRFWNVEFEPNTEPTFMINCDAALEVTQLDRRNAANYEKAGAIDSRAITAAMKGEVAMSRVVVEQIANAIKDSLIVYDLQMIFLVGHLLILKLYENTSRAATPILWALPRPGSVAIINANVQDNALAQAAGAAYELAMTDGSIMLTSGKYSNADINVMRAIGSGVQIVQVHRVIQEEDGEHRFPHTSNGMRTEDINWVLISDRPRDYPPWVAPSSGSILAFMRKLSQDLRCEADAVKGLVKASALYFGRRLRYWTQEGRGLLLDRNMDEDQQENAMGPCLPQDTLNELRIVESRLDNFTAEIEVIEARLDDLYLWYSNGSGAHDLTRRAVDAPGTRLNFVPRLQSIGRRVGITITEYVEVVANERPNVSISDVAKRARIEATPGESDEMRDARRALKTWYYRVMDDILYTRRKLSEVIADYNNLLPRHQAMRAEHNRIRNTRGNVNLFIPCSLEIGSASVPRPQGYNYMWRILNLCGSIKQPAWSELDVDAWKSIVYQDLHVIMAMIGALLSVGTSYSLHVTNMSGVAIHNLWNDAPQNSTPYLEGLLYAADVRSENAPISEVACNLVKKMTNLQIHPLMYYMLDFCHRFSNYTTRYPNGGYAMASGNVILYLFAPLSVFYFIVQFPDVWGIGGQGITLDIDKDINMYNDVEERGWFADLGCADYKNSFKEDCDFKSIPYGAAVINAAFQHVQVHDIDVDFGVRCFVRAGDEGNQMQIRPYDLAEWDDESLCVRIGTIITFNWDRKEVMALCVTGGGEDALGFLAIMRGLPKSQLDAGYVLQISTNTRAAPVATVVRRMKNLFGKGDAVPAVDAKHAESAEKHRKEGN